MLEVLVPELLWHRQQPVRFGPLTVRTRMTVVRLRDGRLWVHSPIEPSTPLVAALAGLGEVAYVVAPNRSHHLYFAAFLEAFPDARGYLAPGLAEKRPALAGHPTIPAAGPWSEDLDSWFADGLPVLNETVWFHRASRTLILTDLLFCFGRDNPPLNRLIAHVLGVHDRLAMSRTMKLAVRERAALLASLAPLRALPIERIVLAHDRIVTKNAPAALERALSWLGRADGPAGRSS